MDVFSLCVASVLCLALGGLAWFVDPSGWSARREKPWRMLALAHGLTWRSAREPLGPSLFGDMQGVDVLCDLGSAVSRRKTPPTLRLIFSTPQDDRNAAWIRNEERSTNSVEGELERLLTALVQTTQAQEGRIEAGALTLVWDPQDCTPERIGDALEPALECVRALRE